MRKMEKLHTVGMDKDNVTDERTHYQHGHAIVYVSCLCLMSFFSCLSGICLSSTLRPLAKREHHRVLAWIMGTYCRSAIMGRLAC